MSVGLSLQIHELTRRFSEELLMLNNRINTTADVVGVNISEDSPVQMEGKFKQFIRDSNHSVRELERWLCAGREKGFINQYDFTRLYTSCEKLVVLVHTLMRSLA